METIGHVVFKKKLTLLNALDVAWRMTTDEDQLQSHLSVLGDLKRDRVTVFVNRLNLFVISITCCMYVCMLLRKKLIHYEIIVSNNCLLFTVRLYLQIK